MKAGSITLGDLQGRVAMLEIACRRCDRKGRLRLDRLIEEHGVDYALPDLRDILAGDCPSAKATAYHDGCGVHFPQLAPLFVTARPS